MDSNAVELDKNDCNLELLRAVDAQLSELPPKERKKREAPVKDFVGACYDSLKSAQSRGYTPEELAKLLSLKGIKTTGGTLRKYMAEVRKEREKRSDIDSARSNASVQLSALLPKPSISRRASLTQEQAQPDDIEKDFSLLTNP